MLKKAYLSIALFLLFHPLYSQTNPDNTPTSKDSPNVEIVSENVEVLKDIELDTSIASLVDSTLIRANKELESAKTAISEANKELESRKAAISQANKELEARRAGILDKDKELESAKTAISEANKELESRKAETLKENEALKSRKDAILKEESDLRAQKKASDIVSASADSLQEQAVIKISKAEEEAELIIAKAKEKQKFFDDNSLLLLAVFSLIVISYLAYQLREFYFWRMEVNDKTVELPEVFRSDWKELSKEISLLTTKNETKKADKKVMELIDKFSANLERFGKKLYIHGESNKAEYVEGLKSLTEQLERNKLENKSLKEGYALNIKIEFFQELISIKEKIEYEESLDKSSNKILRELINKINQTFKRQGISSFELEKGTPLDDESLDEKQFDNVGSEIAPEKSLELCVCRTEKQGYYIKGLNDFKLIVQPAKIIVYKPMKVKVEETEEINNEVKKDNEQDSKVVINDTNSNNNLIKDKK